MPIAWRGYCTLIVSLVMTLSTGQMVPAQPSVVSPEIGPPRGPFVGPPQADARAAPTYERTTPIAGAYYYYWYDVDTGAHIVHADGGDALTHHPISINEFTYFSPAQHEKEFRDMVQAGLDYVLPVCYPSPGEADEWTYACLPPLVEAWEALAGAGLRPPVIGMYYDTTSLRRNAARVTVDAASLEGKLWLYACVRDFFSLVPPQARFTIEGRPVLWLGGTGVPADAGAEVLQHLRDQFRKDFGADLFVVTEASWRAEGDAVYGADAAFAPKLLDVAAFGPGYDNLAVRGPIWRHRDREGGAYYESCWNLLLSRPPDLRPSIVVIDSWNGFHDGTEICESQECGRAYIDLTPKFIQALKEGAVVDVEDAIAAKPVLSIDFGEELREDGLQLVEVNDGPITPSYVGFRLCYETQPNMLQVERQYVYVGVDDQYLHGVRDEDVEVHVEYFDQGFGGFLIEYDSNNRKGSPRSGAFTPSDGAIGCSKSGEWRRAVLLLRDVRFTNLTNGADFRLSVEGGSLAIRRIMMRTLSRIGEAVQ